MRWTLIESQQALLEMLAAHAQAPAVAVDTEFMRRNTFFPRIALLQLCFDDHAWLVDPLALDDTAPIAALFANERIIKVVHSASEDLEVFECWLQQQPAPLFDTQRAAALLNLGFGMGYRALVEQRCGIHLEKGETRSDWLQRPLTEAQCEYAAQDVAHLLPIYDELGELAQAEGRLQWIYEDGAAALAAAGGVNNTYYLRIGSAWKLSRRQLAVLRQICDWREQTAVARDKPRSWIIDDAMCLAIAREMPDSEAAVASLPAMTSGLGRRYTGAILEQVSLALALPDEALPEPLHPPLDARQRRLLKGLKQHARELAQALNIAPEALLPGRDYERLLREAEGSAIAEPAQWQGWRADVAVAPLRAYLAEQAA